MFWLLLPVGLLFWIVCGAIFLALVWVSDDNPNSDSDPLLFAIVALTLILMAVFTDVPFGYVLHHPWFVVVGVLAYIAAGVVWSFFKWYLFNLKQADKYRGSAATYQKQYDGYVTDYATRYPGKTPKTYKEWLLSEYGYPPVVLGHKARLSSWAVYWPVYVAKFVLSDFVQEVWNVIYSWFSGLYQKVTDSVFGQFTELK